MSFKITKQEVSAVESYGIVFVASVVSLYTGGNHDYKNILWSALIATVGPVYKKVKENLFKTQ